MGLLTDFLGSMAQAGGSMLEQDRKRQEEEAKDARLLERQKAMADYTADLNTKKQELLEQLREEREARKQKALVAANDQAEEGMLKIGNDRRFEAFKSKLGQTDATDEESRVALRAAFDQYYNNKAVTVDDKTDTQFMDKKRTDAAGDFYKAARETGNIDLVKSAKDQFKQAQDLDAADAKEQRENRRLTETERANREREELAAARLEKIISGKGSASEVREAINFLDSQRKAITADMSDLRARRKAVREDVSMTPEDRKAANTAFDIEEADLRARGKKAEEMYAKLVPKVFHDEPAPQSDPEKRGMSSSGGSKYTGTGPDGKPTYTSSGEGSPYNPDGTASRNYVAPSRGDSDTIAILKKEYNTALSQGKNEDAAAVAKELKRLGIEVSSKPSESKPAGGQSNAINALPPGSKQIGTSNGVPVYQTPDGKRVIAKQ